MPSDLDFLDLPADLIRRVHQISVALFSETMRDAQLNITPVQFSTLRVLEDQPGVDQATVAALIGYDRATLGKVVDRLVERRMIHRIVSKRDRRARELYLTVGGKDVLRKALPLVQSMQGRLLANLPPSDVATFKATLRQLSQLSVGLEMPVQSAMQA